MPAHTAHFPRAARFLIAAAFSFTALGHAERYLPTERTSEEPEPATA